MADSSDRPTILRELLISLAALSCFMMVCRIYARYFLLRIPGADDALAVVAWVSLELLSYLGTKFWRWWIDGGREGMDGQINNNRRYTDIPPRLHGVRLLG